MGMKTKAKVFLIGWLQVALVVLSTWQIANEEFVGAVVVGFGISLVWTMNVRVAAFGSWGQRLTYCLGASFGTMTGLGLSKILY
jgi:hypothetical protein